MKCDHCANPATVQETVIRNGQVTVRNLCEACARAKGVKVQPGPLAQALTQAVLVQAGGVAEGAGGPVSAGALACGRCGLTYGQFRSTGMLGCAGCYEAFAGPLAPLVSRAHEGATHHVGKAPKRLASQGTVECPGDGGPGKQITRTSALFGTPEERRARIAVLKRQLAEAVAAEQYERAAQLRDELRRVGPEGPGASSGGSVTG